MCKIIPLYQRLASGALLERCVTAKTQNTNEVLHIIIWTKCPKTEFASGNKLKMEECAAICQYNCGYSQSMSDLRQSVGFGPGSYTQKRAQIFDQSRLKFAQTHKKRNLLSTEES